MANAIQKYSPEIQAVEPIRRSLDYTTKLIFEEDCLYVSFNDDCKARHQSHSCTVSDRWRGNLFVGYGADAHESRANVLASICHHISTLMAAKEYLESLNEPASK